MSDAATAQGWPEDLLSTLALFLILLVAVLDLGRSAGRGLGVAVGAIRLSAPTLVPLAEAETATAVGLLGGALTDYVAASQQEPRS